MGIQAGNSKSLAKTGVTQVGGCTECKQAVFSNQEYVRVRKPTIGLNHAWCVPAGSVTAQ